MKKPLQIANGIAFVSTIIINYLSNSGKINGVTIGERSNGIASLFTPAGYAFSIWGLIYLMLFIFVIFQGRSLFNKERQDDFVEKVGIWFVISCVGNSVWVILWSYSLTGPSCIAMAVILFSLIKIILNNRMEIWDAPAKIIAFLWWPFVLYLGWISVASIANVATFLIEINWGRFGLTAETWTFIMIFVATILNAFVIFNRAMREFALVGIWALIAIAVRNWGVENLISYVAVFCAANLFVLVSYHGFKNMKTNPFYLMMKK
ncbi:tryptophan-rich sensory protein [Frigoriflavimonas asaccharolytica]|uniref:TspO/MBR related protein n=1 Tax=Frigoriflavimonas asaccharolytica TaxID=2735899 RepID=A0A8J8GA12_9FLAO|nr:tryptophan-rich sensory protein [Frigoriflavimonas asaccharolytica]NRS91732.1 hypothetical protein [Frigoriflavimonas asaccharolytica]